MNAVSRGNGPVPELTGWRKRIDDKARILTSGLRQHYPADLGKVRRMVIERAREALGDTSPLDMVTLDHEPVTIVKGRRNRRKMIKETATWTTCGFFRETIVASGINRADPMVAESVMLVIQRAIDDVLLG